VEPQAQPAAENIHPVFTGFIGNQAAVDALSIQLQYAEETGAPALRAVGLFGSKSTGKTELARRLARALDVPFLPLSETGLGDVDQLATRMQELAREHGQTMAVVAREGGLPILRSPRMLVFIDEVHQLSSRVQDMLLPVLEADDRTLRGSQVIIDARDVSFVVATTDWGKLREPLRSRVRKVTLEAYTADEVALMLRSRVLASELDASNGAAIDGSVRRLEDNALLAVATAARAVPRVALDLLREVGMALRIGRCEPTADGVWKHLQQLVPCDRNGLTREDHRYLRILARRDRAGLTTIAAELRTDPSNVASAIEPFLVQMGWVHFHPNGRSLTAEGRRLVVDSTVLDR